MSTPGLSEQIVVALSKIGLSLKNQGLKEAGEQGLSATQAQILTLLLTSAGGLRPSQVAERLGVRPPTVTDSARALEDKGLVEKHADPNDARASVLVLTRAGKTKARVSQGWPDFLLEAVDVLQPAEQAAFYAGLVKMIGALQRAGHVPHAAMCLTCTSFQAGTNGAPHFCSLLKSTLAPTELRIDCAEHSPASSEAVERTWATLTG